MSSSETQASTSSIPADHFEMTSISLPPYWAGDPLLWFAQIECRFAQHRLTTQKAKFNAVVSSLPPQVAAEVWDLITSPPSEDAYDKLKKAIVDRTGLSRSDRLQQLLGAEQLQGRTPSQFLRHMRALSGRETGDFASDEILQELFMRQLPQPVRVVLAATGPLPLSQLAQVADKVVEQMDSNRPTLAATQASSSAPQPHASPDSEESSLLKIILQQQKQINLQQRQMEELKAQFSVFRS